MKSNRTKTVGVITLLYFIPAFAIAATLSLSPATGTKTVGDTFSVDVVLDTEGVPVDGVDIVHLNYNPSLIQVQDGSTTIAGIQITPGNLMPSLLVNSVDDLQGKITFSQVSGGGANYNGSGILATISFKAIAAGIANLTFDHTPGLTTDSNVASGLNDVLSNATGASYTINNPIVQTPLGSGGGSVNTGGGGGGGGSSGGSSGNPIIFPPTNISTTTNPGVNQVTTYSPVIITRWLTIGSIGSDVLQLKKGLNQNGFIISTTGPDSLNNETNYFGSTTAIALKRFQCTKLQVCQGTPETTGYGAVGPRTRQALSALKVAVVNSLAIVGSATTTVPGCPIGFTCKPVLINATTSQIIIQDSTTTAATFTRNLALGSRGNDVKALQRYLNSNGFIVATIGSGSPGNETMYFGPATRAALIRFQKAKGITPAEGYFGPLTRIYFK